MMNEVGEGVGDLGGNPLGMITKGLLPSSPTPYCLLPTGV